MTHSSYLGHKNNFLPKIGSAILSVYCNLTQKKRKKKSNQPISRMLQKNKWTVRAEFIGVSGRVVWSNNNVCSSFKSSGYSNFV